MFKFWKWRLPARPVFAEARPLAGPRGVSGEVAAEMRRTSDTNGTLRRMRQTVENNRLL